MKKILSVLSLAGLAAFSTMAHAADAKKPVAFWQCSDLLAVDESFQPTALGYAAAINQKDNVQYAVLDVDGMAKLQPQIIKYCKENPTVALRDAIIQSDGKPAK